MDDETRKAIGQLLEQQRTLLEQMGVVLRLAGEAKQESLVLQTVCGALAAEVAAGTEDPQAKLAEIVAGLQGAAERVASDTGVRSVTETMERICATAEMLLSGGGN